MSNSEYIRLCIEDAKSKQEQNEFEARRNIARQKEINETNSELLEKQEGDHRKKVAFNKFSEDVRNTLLSECIYRIYDKALGIHVKDDTTNLIKKNLVNNFIAENGAVALLGHFRNTSNLLSEMSFLVAKYHKAIIEAVDKDKEESYVIDPIIRDRFFDELDLNDVDSVVANIRMRVTDAVEEFIQGNINDKIDIESALKDAQEKINAAKVDEVKESYSLLAKRKISETRNNRVKNVFSCMVESMSKAVISNEALHEEFMKNGKMNIDKIVERCELMYTFLETVNSSKMVNVNEEYIENVLDSMKQ